MQRPRRAEPVETPGERPPARALTHSPGTSSMAICTKRSSAPWLTCSDSTLCGVAQEQRHVVAGRLDRGEERQRRPQPLTASASGGRGPAGPTGSGRRRAVFLDSVTVRWSSGGRARAGCACRSRRRSARTGALCGSVATPGRSSANSAAVSVRNGRITGALAIIASNIGGVSEIVSCSDGHRDPGQRAERRVEVGEQLAPGSGPPAPARPRSSPGRGRSRRGRCSATPGWRATGSQVAHQRHERADRVVDVIAPAGQRLAEADRRCAGRRRASPG